VKKVLLSILLTCLLFSGCQKTDSTDILVKEDIDTFNYFFENAYVFYDDLQSQRAFKFKPDRVFKQYKKYLKKWPESHVENGINQSALMNALAAFLYDIKAIDNHLSLIGAKQSWSVYPKNVVYTSDYYFSKQNGLFILSESPDQSLNGKTYTGNSEDIKKVIRNKKEIYQFAPNFREENRNEAVLLLEGKKHKIPVKHKYNRNNEEELFELKETQDTLYFKINSFSITFGSDEHEKFMSVLKEVSGIVESKKNLVLDLRGNHGGDRYYVYQLIAALYNIWDDEFDKNQLMEFLNHQNYGTIYIDSEAVAKARYDFAVRYNMEPDYIEETKEYYEYLKGTGKREIGGDDNVNMTILPQYKRKKLDTKIFVITDYDTASASEETIGLLYMMDKENVTLIGLNTSGALVGVDVLSYELPNSKILLTLTARSNKKTIICSLVDSWKGENYGFTPDYWVTDDSFSGTLEFLSGDKEIVSFF